MLHSDECSEALDLETQGEQRRLQALARYDIMDTAPEADYDAITMLVCELLGADIALLNFIDADRLWVKSSHGTTFKGMPRHEALCNLVLADSEELFVIEDISSDPRADTLAARASDVVSYIGAPLRAHTGERIGVLAVCFLSKKKLDERELLALRTLRRQIEITLEQRRALAMVQLQQTMISRLTEQHGKLLTTVSHDTRNLLAGILSNCEFAIHQIDAHAGEAREAIEDALSAAQQAKSLLHHIDDSKRRFKEDTHVRMKANHEVF